MNATATRAGEFVRYTRRAELAGLEVMSARWLEHSFPPHMHDFYAVSLNGGGRGAFDCRRECRDAAPGTCNLIAPGELHTGRATSPEGWSYRNLYVDAALMATLLAGVDWPGATGVGFRSPLVRDPVLVGRLGRAIDSLTERNALLQDESLLLAVVARLATHHLEREHVLSDAGREHAAVRRTRERLDATPEDNVSIRDLADMLGLSPYHLVRAFHRQVGVPPHRYQIAVRVQRARRLLAAGADIAEVAYATGFCDQSHLNRCFKRVMGATPGSYVAGTAPRGTA